MPGGSSEEFFKLMGAVSEIIDPQGPKKRASLMVPESEWPGVDDWLERWRGVPWPEKKKGVARS